MASYTFPSVQDFKDYFTRDFPYGTDPELAILDSDITKAMQMTNLQINPNIWPTQSAFTVAYLLLTAHFLVENIRASSQGIVGQYNFLQSGKSATGVSESFSIPQAVLDDPNYAMYCKTHYGKQYLFMALPRIRGAMFTVKGRTQP